MIHRTLGVLRSSTYPDLRCSSLRCTRGRLKAVLRCRAFHPAQTGANRMRLNGMRDSRVVRMQWSIMTVRCGTRASSGHRVWTVPWACVFALRSVNVVHEATSMTENLKVIFEDTKHGSPALNIAEPVRVAHSSGENTAVYGSGKP